MSRRLRRWTHKFAGESGYERMAGDLEVQGNLIGPSMALMTTAIDKIVSGTTTPVKLTINVCEGMYKAIRLQWLVQYNLMNFDHYELQVSEDNTNWYSLKSDGTDWKDTLNADTDVVAPAFIHAAIPFLGTAEAPIGRKLYYRMRQKSIMGVASAWSDTVNATTSTVETGDIAADTIYGNQMKVGEIRAREIAFADDVYGNAHEYPVGAELFDLGQPDCQSSIGRLPTVRDTVFAPGEIEDELGNKYLGPHAPKFTGQSGAIFAARTNLVTNPEDLTAAAGWSLSGAVSYPDSIFVKNKRLTRVACTGAGTAYVYRDVEPTIATPSIQCIIRRGTGDVSRILFYDRTAPASRGRIDVTWATNVVSSGDGLTLLHYEWIDVDTVLVSGVCTGVVAANDNEILFYPSNTEATGLYTYITAVQVEDNSWPSPYIDRTRWITQIRPAVSPDYAVTMPGKFLFEIKIRPWFAYDTAINHRIVTWRIDATHSLIVYYTASSDQIIVWWQDGVTSRYLTSTAFTTNINQELTLFGALNLDSGGTNDSRLVVFLEDGTKFSEDTAWSGAPDVKASTFSTLSIGHVSAGTHADSIISYTKFWTWDGAALGTINTEADVDAIVQNKTSLFDLELEPYETAYQPINKQGAIGIFQATTNLAPTPEDLTSASWNLEAGCGRALSAYYIEGKQFTQVTSNGVDTGVYSATFLYTGNGIKGFSCWLRRGTSATAQVLVYDAIVMAWRLNIVVTWATKGIVASVGTLRDTKWVSDDLVWISGITTAVTAANTHQVYCRVGTAASTAYFTAIMTENSSWPTPYTPTTRIVGQLTYRLPAGLPDKLSIICRFRPWFSYDTTFSHLVWSFYIDPTHQLNCYYEPTTDMFNVSWMDGGAGRILASQQFGGAFDVLNQEIVLAASIDLSVGGITTGSFFKVYATSILKDSAWSGNIDSKVSTFSNFYIGWQAIGTEAQGFVSDLMFLPGVLLTEEQCDRHYNMMRPWYSPSEAAAGNRSVRIDKSGIRMHNAGLTISDNLNRLIDISNRTGLLARDAAGAVIHDIPNAPILIDMNYGGHILWKVAPDYLGSILIDYTDVQVIRTGTTAVSNINISDYIGNLTNVKGALIFLSRQLFLAAAKSGVGSYIRTNAYYCHIYNDSTDYAHQYIDRAYHRAEVAAIIQRAEGGIPAVIPVVYNGVIPYISWLADYDFNMLNGNAQYFAYFYLYLLGVLT